ncbi:ribonuclease III [Thiotrichales bacterium 19S11-10]|nr:ribonuclease III [Thiotrichales bacterium 19S11-10]MCF6807421.1 ribonuclease III [Thiotrichales bacterium 19S9-11]MCF6811390.1 ribonuclease III [Thiotrichales bacterium 19S9-12]
MKELNVLYQAIGYTFDDTDLLTQALTHRSLRKKHNERLEFLGDAILGMVIAEALYHQFPEAKEGQLSLLRISIVKGKTLTDKATELNLGDYLALGIGEIKSGGHKRASILEDAIEALVGAIYLDSNLEEVRRCILTWFKYELDNLTLVEVPKDSKTQLQEILQADGVELPEYQLIETEGLPHQQTFKVKCLVRSLNLSATSQASSRKGAEQLAANEIIQKLNKNT